MEDTEHHEEEHPHQEQQHQEDVCDIAAGDPPHSNKNPLPPYGELYQKRQLHKSHEMRNRCMREAIEAQCDKDKEGSKSRKSLVDTNDKLKTKRHAVHLHSRKRTEELAMISNEAKDLFRPHGLPKDIHDLPDQITFTDGLKLREICRQIREQHWAYICQRKVDYREKVWKWMHVDKIPCGNLRESFAYSFQIYIPEKSHLPITHDNAMPW